jgi:hypothetical protein
MRAKSASLGLLGKWVLGGLAGEEMLVVIGGSHLVVHGVIAAVGKIRRVR